MNARLVGPTFCAFIAAALMAQAAEQDSLTPDETAFFESQVRPLLIERCYECHSQANPVKGGLTLDSRGGWETGGDRGPAIVPGKPDESLLIQAVRYQDADLQMPPTGRLSDAQIAVLEAWVARGAPDPRVDAAPVPASEPGVDVRREHWAYQALQAAAPPSVADGSWPLSDIDRFVLARLEEHGLHPSGDADRHTWLRRVSLDLTGLPPTPSEIEAFINDSSADAWGHVVDRLLASPAFGERWARPWLDLVGYADQIGSANNVPAEHAWRYRDYVIRAFSSDKPFDRFVHEQLAGDLMTAGSIEERQDQLTATGFLVLGNVNVVEADKLLMRMDLVDQQIEKIGKAFLGLTLNCVRCHDHKFDPITLQDYYGLAGILASTESTYKINRGVWSTVTQVQLPETLDQFTAREARLREHERKVAAVQRDRAAALARIAELDPLIAAAKDGSSPATDGAAPLAQLEEERGKLAGQAQALESQLWHLDYLAPTPPRVFAAKDGLEIADVRTQVRGNPHVLGEVVPRGFIDVVTHGPRPPIPADRSGRLELAQWLTSAAHPLMARVTVNRIWQRLFGRGIVGSVDYFGLRGEAPTHRELLDYLAGQFIGDGWSHKRLIRLVVLSRTYRQRSDAGPESTSALAADPDNRFFWRMSPRRLEAEMLRDAILAASGGLQPSSGGPALAPEFAENVGGLNPTDVNPISFSLSRFRDDQTRLRTIYLPVVRSSEQRGPADALNFFDFPQPAQCTGQRPTTAVASQALFLLNGPLLWDGADRLTATLLADTTLASDDDRIAILYLRLLNRPPAAEETQAAREFLMSAANPPAAGGLAAGGAGGDSAEDNSMPNDKAAWRQLAHALLASNEFLFRL